MATTGEIRSGHFLALWYLIVLTWFYIMSVKYDGSLICYSVTNLNEWTVLQEVRYEEEIGKHITTSDYWIKNLIFTMSPLYHKEFGDEQSVTVPLFASLHSTSESILILLQNQAVFDADILLRSVMEGTIK